MASDSETAIATAFENIGLHWMSFFVCMAAMLGISASTFSTLLAETRLLAALANEGFIWSRLAEVTEKNTYIISSIFMFILISILCFPFDIEVLWW